MTLSYLPFFALGHLYAKFSDYAMDGYSAPYQLAIQLSSILYLIIGLLYLHKVLRLFFAEYIATLAIICICFGSNVFYFLNMTGGTAHIVGFMLIAIFVYYTIEWHQYRNLRSSLIIGALTGLLALVRPPDLAIILFFFLYEVKSWRGIVYKWKLYSKHVGLVLLMIGMLVVIYLLQPLACNLCCHAGMFSSCCNIQEQGPLSGRSLTVLDFRPAMLIYAPVLLFSLIGFGTLSGYMRKFLIPCLGFFILYIVTAFIWWNTVYAASFGYRTLIDIYPVLALPFCALLSKMLNLGNYTRRLLYVLIFVFVVLNLWITLKLGLSHTYLS